VQYGGQLKLADKLLNYFFVHYRSAGIAAGKLNFDNVAGFKSVPE
jgi:hypothetical protein